MRAFHARFPVRPKLHSPASGEICSEMAIENRTSLPRLHDRAAEKTHSGSVSLTGSIRPSLRAHASGGRIETLVGPLSDRSMELTASKGTPPNSRYANSLSKSKHSR